MDLSSYSIQTSGATKERKSAGSSRQKCLHCLVFLSQGSGAALHPAAVVDCNFYVHVLSGHRHHREHLEPLCYPTPWSLGSFYGGQFQTIFIIVIPTCSRCSQRLKAWVPLEAVSCSLPRCCHYRISLAYSVLTDFLFNPLISNTYHDFYSSCQVRHLLVLEF